MYGIMSLQSEFFAFTFGVSLKKNIDSLSPKSSSSFLTDQAIDIPASEPSNPPGPGSKRYREGTERPREASTPSPFHVDLEALCFSDTECEATANQSITCGKTATTRQHWQHVTEVIHIFQVFIFILEIVYGALICNCSNL